MYGAVIVAPDVYYPGTVIRIALENAAAAQGPGEMTPYAGVWGKVLRKVSEGFCVGFVFESRAERKQFRSFLDELRRRSLDETNGNKTESIGRAVTD